MLTELLAARAEWTVSPLRLAPPVSDRAVWDRLPCADRWLAEGNAVPRAVPPLPLHLWQDFTVTGRRDRFETVYFARRRGLCALVMAECVSGAGQFVSRIADYCWAICEESAWQLPAHNSYLRDTPQLPLPDPDRPVIDLFAAETGALLAVTRALLGRTLDAAAPGLSARMAREVKKRILTPYRKTHFWWMGSGSEPMCNWTPWCTQNVLLAAGLLLPARALPPYVRQAAYSLDCFLKDYGTDGCCSEGAQYYRHAALTFWAALDLLCRMVPGVFDAAWAEPKVKNLAEYIVNMHVAGPYYLNFADCSPLAGSRGVREFLFGQRVGSAPLTALAAADFAADADRDRMHCPDASEGINLYYHLLTALHEQELLAYPRQEASAGDSWYPSVGIRVVRRGACVLGAKAGNNADSHNHNDVGSLTLWRGETPVLLDLGVETYCKKTFSPQRYEIWTMQSSWHNLPEFDGRQQQPGAAFAARDVQCLPDGLTLDLAPAYGPVPGLEYYRRTALLSEKGLVFTDETDYPRPVALTLLSLTPLTDARFEGADRVETETVPIKDARLRQAWPGTVTRTRVWFTGRLRAEVR